MVGASNSSAAVGIVGLVLAAGCSVPAVVQIYRRLSGQKYNGWDPLYQLYEDKDGVSKAEVQRAFSDKIQKYIILLGTVSGISVCLALAIFATLHRDTPLLLEQWLQFGVWVCELSSLSASLLTWIGYLTLAGCCGVSRKALHDQIQSGSPWVSLRLCTNSGHRARECFAQSETLHERLGRRPHRVDCSVNCPGCHSRLHMHPLASETRRVPA